MPGPEKKWDATVERDLCVAIIMGAQDGDRMRYNWPKVHGSMETLGYSFSKDAISYVFLLLMAPCQSFASTNRRQNRQHFSKTIMKEFRARHGDTFAVGSPSPAPKKATPRKRTPSVKKSKKKVDSEEDDDDDDDAAAESPLAKKVKRDGGEDDDAVKSEDAGGRKHSATAADNEDESKAWLAADKEAEK
ncbi:hypothetical protein FZEAL_9866 [Fusarium zealandicum]|uniref:Uncharacterized protein n=1 Tax=Fusarium zealandicum TaxID=1053134 RepID=A0A8H4U8B3_9HYPO|nr:hypothetical protein FZEAL_9866 [Fusarium zealandicum]